MNSGEIVGITGGRIRLDGELVSMFFKGETEESQVKIPREDLLVSVEDREIRNFSDVNVTYPNKRVVFITQGEKHISLIWEETFDLLCPS